MGLFDILKQKTQTVEENKDLQQTALAVYTCILTDCNREDVLHCCKLFNAIEIAVLPAIEICKKAAKNKLYDALLTVKNQQQRELFISLCCSFQSFLQNNNVRKMFTEILLSWGYSALEIRLTLSEAVHNVAFDENVPNTPFPFTMREQDIILKTWLRIKTGKDVFVLASADRLNQEQKYAAFGFAISLCHPLYILEDDRECVYRALANLAINLGFNPISFEDAFIHQTFTDRKRYIEIINSIKDDSILMCLTYTCQAILEWANYRFSEPNFIINIFQKLGYTFEESIAITQGKIIHKFNDAQQQKGTLTQNQNIDENEDSEYYAPSFIHNWKLSDILKDWGDDIQMKETTDHLTGEIKVSLVFQNCWEQQIYVNRVSHLTDLSIPEIVEKKEELLIGVTQRCNFWLHDGRKLFYMEADQIC